MSFSDILKENRKRGFIRPELKWHTLYGATNIVIEYGLFETVTKTLLLYTYRCMCVRQIGSFYDKYFRVFFTKVYKELI